MKLTQKATLISSIVGASLALLKLTIGIMSGSIAILSSAIDSILDMLVSAFNFFAVTKSQSKADTSYNFGKGKLEALAAFLEGLIITLSGFFILYESIKKIIYKTEISHIQWGIAVMCISLCITTILVIYLKKIAEKTGNLVLKSDALHYMTDLLSNAGILISMTIIYFTDFWVIDGIIGFIIGCYIIFEAIKIVNQGYKLLLDKALDIETVQKIKSILTTSPDIKGYHELKTRCSANINFVQAHLVFDKNTSLFHAHKISHKLEDTIKTIDKKNKWSILFHLDPYDDSHIDAQDSI